jgi:hypothetical protein
MYHLQRWTQRSIVLRYTRLVWNATYENIREAKEIREAIIATYRTQPNMNQETRDRIERLRMEYKEITGEDIEEEMISKLINNDRQNEKSIIIDQKEYKGVLEK